MSDTDKDGKITLEELTAWTKKSLRSVYKQEAKERLKRLDTNKDGKVSWEEYLKSKEDVGGKWLPVSLLVPVYLNKSI